MAKKKSIQPAKFDSLLHNYRKKFTANEVFFDEQNEHLRTYEQAKALKVEFIDKAVKNYTANTGQKPQTRTIYAYSFVCTCTQDTTPQELYDSVGKYLKESLGVEIFDIAVHKDEGYIISKENDRELYSGVDFAYDGTKQAYYKKDYQRDEDGEYSIFLAQNLAELKEKYTIKKNYHAHFEFSGVREDGSSINKPCFADKKKPKNEHIFKTKNKGQVGIIEDLPQRAIELLNKELIKNGKEPVKQHFNTDSSKPTFYGITSIKRLSSFLQREKFDGIETLSEKEKKEFEELKKEANYKGVKAYNELQNLKRTKTSVKKIVNEKIREFDEKFKDIKLEFKKPFFTALVRLRENFDPKANDFGVLLDEIGRLASKFYEKLNALSSENSALQAENTALWQRVRQKYDISKNGAQNAQNDLSVRLRYFDELKNEIESLKRDELLAEKFFKAEFNSDRLWQLALQGYLTDLNNELNSLLNQAKMGYDIKNNKAANLGLPTKKQKE